MVIAAGRAYADLVRWMKKARPRGLRPWRLTRSIFRACVVGSTLVLGGIGLLRPSRFGSLSSRPGGGPEWWALALFVALCLIAVVVRWRRTAGAAARLMEPWRRSLRELPSFEPAASALESCPAPLRTRFAIGWVWGPALLVVAGAFFAASAIYFVIDAILAGFSIGWEQPLLAVINMILSLVVLRVGAGRLATWRLAWSVHREVTGGYL